MQHPERRPIAYSIVAVIILAVLLTVPGYFSSRVMDVGGSANTDVGLSGAVLAGIACIATLVGLIFVWLGRARPAGNTRVALVATLVVSVFLLLVAFAAGTSSNEPASTTVERNAG